MIYRFQDMNVLQRLLHAVTSPEIAYLLLLVGFFGIIFELYNPGIGLGGILGGICLLLGFYGLSVSPDELGRGAAHRPRGRGVHRRSADRGVRAYGRSGEWPR